MDAYHYQETDLISYDLSPREIFRSQEDTIFLFYHSPDIWQTSRCSQANITTWPITVRYSRLNRLRPGRNGRHFSDDIFKCIFLSENVSITIKISLTFVPKGPINNILALVQIMAWRRPGDKPFSEPMMVNLPTHICVTQPQWIKRGQRY